MSKSTKTPKTPATKKGSDKETCDLCTGLFKASEEVLHAVRGIRTILFIIYAINAQSGKVQIHADKQCLNFHFGCLLVSHPKELKEMVFEHS